MTRTRPFVAAWCASLFKVPRLMIDGPYKAMRETPRRRRRARRIGA